MAGASPSGREGRPKAEIAQAVADGRRPAAMAADEEIVFDFCTELHATRSVSDATYQRALEKFGEQASSTSPPSTGTTASMR